MTTTPQPSPQNEPVTDARISEIQAIADRFGPNNRVAHVDDLLRRIAQDAARIAELEKRLPYEALKDAGCVAVTNEGMATLREEQACLDFLEMQRAVIFGHRVGTPEDNMELGPPMNPVVMKVGLGQHQRTFLGTSKRGCIQAAMKSAPSSASDGRKET